MPNGSAISGKGASRRRLNVGWPFRPLSSLPPFLYRCPRPSLPPLSLPTRSDESSSSPRLRCDACGFDLCAACRRAAEQRGADTDLAVGARVALAAGYAGVASAAQGCLRPGDVGEVVEVEDGANLGDDGYQVRGGSLLGGWVWNSMVVRRSVQSVKYGMFTLLQLLMV